MRFQYFPVVFLLAFSSSPLSADLLTHVTVDTSVSGTWSYAAFNDELPGSPNYINSLNVLVNAPITVTGTPTGWNVITDDVSYVFWFSADLALPYPDDIAPGSSLGGFSILSTGAVSSSSTATIAAWDHVADAPGPSFDTSVLAPSVPSTVPEPSTFSFLLITLGVLLVCCSRRVSAL